MRIKELNRFAEKMSRRFFGAALVAEGSVSALGVNLAISSGGEDTGEARGQLASIQLLIATVA